MSLPTSGSDPRVGVAAIIQRPDGRVIFGRRNGSHGAGSFIITLCHYAYGAALLGPRLAGFPAVSALLPLFHTRADSPARCTIATLHAEIGRSVRLLGSQAWHSGVDSNGRDEYTYHQVVTKNNNSTVVKLILYSQCIGKWAFPGGHLEYGENFAACAERETMEETGLKVKGVRLVNATNDVFADVGRHYITLFVVCEMVNPEAEPQVSRLLKLLAVRQHTSCCPIIIALPALTVDVIQ